MKKMQLNKRTRTKVTTCRYLNPNNRARSLTTLIPHSINCEEIGTSEGLWGRLGRQKMTNMSFSTFSKPVALLCEAELTGAKLGAFKTLKNDMFVIVRLPK